MGKTATTTRQASARPKRSHAKDTVGSAPRLAGYPQALKYLNERTDVERSRPSRLAADVFKLDRTVAILEALGNPHDGVRLVHVAGSKGKGSTCEMTASCLQACGYTVGLFTSPHLVDVRERVRINGRLIPHADFTRVMQMVAEAVHTVAPEHGEPTFFELITCAGLTYFADQAVDIAVLETGLGGRLDCTNVVKPEVTAITQIYLDHTQILGDTLEAIAREKAGIFKPGIPALTIKQPPEVLEVLAECAEAAGTQLEVVGKDIDFSFRFESAGHLGPHARVCLTTPRNSYEHLPVPLKGEHQALNCGLSLAILDRLTERGFNTPETAVLAGLEQTEARGRMEIAWPEPRVLLDGAHNPDSVKALVRAIGAHLPYDSMVVIFGCAQDKDIDGMLHQIALGADKVIFTKSASNPRAADPAMLHERFGAMSQKMAQTAPTFDKALTIAARAVNRDDLICVTGSFYLVGEAKRVLAQKSNG